MGIVEKSIILLSGITDTELDFCTGDLQAAENVSITSISIEVLNGKYEMELV